MTEQWHVFLMASQVDVQHRDAKVFQSPRCVHADLTHVQRPLTALFVSEQVQLSTQHPVLLPAWAVWLVQDQLAWGPWQGTAGTRASVNNTQWSPSSLTSVPASAHSCHPSASWVVLVFWNDSESTWSGGITHLLSVGVSATTGVSQRTWKTAAVLTVISRRVEYCSDEGSRSW